MDTKINIIYIPLLNEGTVVYRPTYGIRLKDLIFKVLLPENYDPEDEQWAFSPGKIVYCEWRLLTDKTVLVAVREYII